MKRRSIAFFFAAVFACAAAAQALSTTPSGIGRPHTCGEEYPREAVMQGIQGTTTLGFTITVEGGVADITVLRSSGNQMLDDAAVSCVSKWRYKPALAADGQPVAAPWKANVVWELHKRNDPNAEAFGLVARFLVQDARECLAKASHFKRIPDDFSKTTILSFVRKGDRDGKVAITVTQPSGDSELDDEAIVCFRRSPFLPKLMDLIPGKADKPDAERRFVFPIYWQIVIQSLRQQPPK